MRWLTDGEAAEVIARLPQRPLLAGEQGLRLSLAGAQVKLPVVIDTGSEGRIRLGLPLGSFPSTHIIKPEPLRFPGLAENQAWCMALARRIGLDAAESWLERIGGVPCLISKRYDRMQGASGEIVQRLHQEDFCQAASKLLLKEWFLSGMDLDVASVADEEAIPRKRTRVDGDM